MGEEIPRLCYGKGRRNGGEGRYQESIGLHGGSKIHVFVFVKEGESGKRYGIWRCRFDIRFYVLVPLYGIGGAWVNSVKLGQKIV